jgi:hypothetical protein
MTDINRAAEFGLNPHIPEWYPLKRKEVFCSKPTNRNFSILPLQNENGLTLLLQKLGKTQTEDLHKFLPEGDEFIPTWGPQYDPLSHLVGYDPGDLQYKGAALTILHEIGHARIYQPHPKTELSFIKKTLVTLEGLPRLIKADQTLGQRLQHISVLSLETIFPKWFAEICLTYNIKNERNAWAEALKIAKQLEKKGFNVLGEFNNLGEIQEFVAFSLTSYDYAMRFGQQLVGDSVTPGRFTKRAT